MKKIVFLLMVGFLLIGVNLYAGDGDLIVDGKVGIGTETPTNKLELLNGNIMLWDNITQGYAVSPNKIILKSNSQVTPAVEFCGMGVCGNLSFDEDNGWFSLSGGGLSLGRGQLLKWQGLQATITSSSAGNIEVYASDSFTMRTNNDNSGTVKIPYGKVGIGTTTPAEKLDVAGAIKVADTGSLCTSSNAGAIKFESPNFKGCTGSEWVQLNNVPPAP